MKKATSNTSKSTSSNHIRPAHYQCHPSGIECITIAEHFNFNVGNVFKYLWRSKDVSKAQYLINLAKAKQYIDFEIAKVNRG